jgi:hypothetical protein
MSGSEGKNRGDTNKSECITETTDDEDGERTFTLFPKLPKELRLMTWKVTLLDFPRVIP